MEQIIIIFFFFGFRTKKASCVWVFLDLKEGSSSLKKWTQFPRVSYLQNENGEVDAQIDLLARREVGELVVEICADAHVGEHTVQLVGELVPTRLLQRTETKSLCSWLVPLLVDRLKQANKRVFTSSVFFFFR